MVNWAVCLLVRLNSVLRALDFILKSRSAIPWNNKLVLFEYFLILQLVHSINEFHRIYLLVSVSLLLRLRMSWNGRFIRNITQFSWRIWIWMIMQWFRYRLGTLFTICRPLCSLPRTQSLHVILWHATYHVLVLFIIFLNYHGVLKVLIQSLFDNVDQLLLLLHLEFAHGAGIVALQQLAWLFHNLLQMLLVAFPKSLVGWAFHNLANIRPSHVQREGLVLRAEVNHLRPTAVCYRRLHLDAVLLDEFLGVGLLFGLFELYFFLDSFARLFNFVIT